jgi:hypothetical protein
MCPPDLSDWTCNRAIVDVAPSKRLRVQVQREPEGDASNGGGSS